MSTNIKVALVHDYLREYGGAERVVEDLHEIFPEAPIFTAYYNPQGLGVNNDRIKEWDIKTSWMQKVPFGNRLISPFRIFAPLMFGSFDLSDFDVIVSSDAIYFAKSVGTTSKQLHISYIHTPPRYLYGFTTSYNYKKHWWTRIGGEIMNHFLRIWDFQISQRPDILVANSKNVQARIKKFYRRDSVVIYPPVGMVDTVCTSLEASKARPFSARPGLVEGLVEIQKGYYLSLGRLVRGKGTEIIVEACTKLNLPLKVVGAGPELGNLKKMAGNNVEFLGAVKDENLPEILIGAKAVIVASEDEDFGIVPVESMAVGTPVIAVKAGGFLETVVPGKTGEFFPEASVDSLVKVLKDFNPKKYDPENCKKQAEKFSKERFKKEILDLISKNLRS